MTDTNRELVPDSWSLVRERAGHWMYINYMQVACYSYSVDVKHHVYLLMLQLNTQALYIWGFA